MRLHILMAFRLSRARSNYGTTSDILGSYRPTAARSTSLSKRIFCIYIETFSVFPGHAPHVSAGQYGQKKTTPCCVLEKGK